LLGALPQYANIRTKTDRFGKDFKDKKLDVVYDTDTGNKKYRPLRAQARARARQFPVSSV
jgi:hypothetical protein